MEPTLSSERPLHQSVPHKCEILFSQFPINTLERECVSIAKTESVLPLDVPALVTSIGVFSWPVVTLIVVFFFKDKIERLGERIASIDALGASAKFRSDLRALESAVETSAQQVSSLPEQATDSHENGVEFHGSFEENRKEILEISKSQPELGVIKISALIEKNLVELIATMGLLSNVRILSIRQMVEEMVKRNAIAPAIAASMERFLKIRNLVVHGRVSHKADIVGAIDVGLNLLKAVQAIPHEKHVTKRIRVPLYSDDKCEVLMTDVSGIELVSTYIHGTNKMIRIFPTTRDHFVVGKQVAWEWNTKRVYGPTWYRNEQGEILTAWHGAGEFVGRNIEEI